MEFTTGRRDGFYIIGEESKHPSLCPLSSSSSSTPPISSAFRWHVGPSDSASNGTGGGRRESNFFTEKEHMFDKVVTPSDVGKLNRLVIPKQHAEKYFPLDLAANEKGLLLSFEDRTGKSWRFRYSYWNSSQSYVMTKGWSRFVKEKRLDAGDIVSFGRGVGESGSDHLYIDWKPRLENHDIPRLPPLVPLTGVSLTPPLGPWGGRFFFPPGAGSYHHRLAFGYDTMISGTTSADQFHFFRSSVAGAAPQVGVQHDSGSAPPLVLNSQPLLHNQAEAKRVRLFGVNLDSPETQDDPGAPSDRSPSARRLRTCSTHPFPPFPRGSTESSAASSSTSKEHHLTLDLGL
ncbi:unnamed protein product [Musa hybrid cultivar]